LTRESELAESGPAVSPHVRSITDSQGSSSHTAADTVLQPRRLFFYHHEHEDLVTTGAKPHEGHDEENQGHDDGND
jgi:hypothetical protein